MSLVLKREGRDQAYNIHLAHNNLSGEIAFQKVIRISERTGCPAYFVHVTAKEGVLAMAEARGNRLPVYGEVLHHFLCFTSEGGELLPYQSWPEVLTMLALTVTGEVAEIQRIFDEY